MKPRFVTREAAEQIGWYVYDKTSQRVISYCPTRKIARERAKELNALQVEWKSDVKAAE